MTVALVATVRNGDRAVTAIAGRDVKEPKVRPALNAHLAAMVRIAPVAVLALEV